MKAFLGRLLSFILLAAIAYFLYQWLIVPAMTFRTADENRPTVLVYRVPYPVMNGLLKTPGQVLPFEEKAVTSPMSGKVLEVFVSQGDLLEEGAPIYRLDSKSARQRILNLQAQAQSLIEEDQVDFDSEPDLSSTAPVKPEKLEPEIKTVIMKAPQSKIKKVKAAVSDADKDPEDKKVASPQKTVHIETPEEVLKADIRRQSQLLSDAVVRMPYRALVRTVIVETDSVVEKGDVVIKVDSGHAVDIKIALPWDNLARLALKQVATISTTDTAFPLRYRAWIVSIDSKPENCKTPMGYAVLRIPRYEQPQLDPKQSVMVHLQYSQPGNLLLLPDAIHFEGKAPFVFLASPSLRGENDGTYVIKRREVVLGEPEKQSVVLKSGLQAGDLLVLRNSEIGPIPIGQPVSVMYDEALYQKKKAARY